MYTYDNNGDDNMKKGFTLIELLAVIIVLSVVAVIAIPIIGSVIESGKTGAIENSANIYIKEIETKFSEWTVEGMPNPDIFDNGEDGYAKIDVQNLNSILDIDGDAPISGIIKISNDYSSDNHFFGYVVEADLIYDGDYSVIYRYDTSGTTHGNRATIEVHKGE